MIELQQERERVPAVPRRLGPGIALGAAAGPAVFTLTWLVLGFVSRGYTAWGVYVPYSPIHQGVSGLGLGETALYMNAAFIVNLPNRRSISPDAAFYTGKRTGMKFLEGAPVFAAEVRSENDYGPAAEQTIADKRADYFAAGTLVVWDVDLLDVDVVKAYKASDPEHPSVYRRGDLAEAEPAVPGWTMPVDDLFV